MKRIIIIGGGLAGLVSSIALARAGATVQLMEKKHFPFHRVCGEYISHETTPFLKTLGLYPSEFAPPQINRFLLSSTQGRKQEIPLSLGGFGISRFAFDHFLYQKAVSAGVDVKLDTEVIDVRWIHGTFQVKTEHQELEADIVIGSHGKRSKLDVTLDRDFIKKRSPYVGVKYHVRTDHPENLIALHNFSGGYCGISRVENDTANLCYLVHRDALRKYGSVPDLEHAVLFLNPLLKSIFQNSDFLFQTPETINEISFETKSPVDDHILMVGDSAGMITPLCGNGMAMAIHSAKLASELILRHVKDASFTRDDLENNYARAWRKNFAQRLWNGRQIQKLFGNETASNFAVNLAIYVKPVANMMVRASHGKPF